MKDEITTAIKEAILYMEASPDSPRHWAVSRVNLTKLLTEALEHRKRELSARAVREHLRRPRQVPKVPK